MIPLFTDKKKWFEFVMILIDWLGTPYAHWQTVKGKGADCGLFIAACLKELGVIDNIEYKYAPRFWHKFTNNEVLLNIIKDFKSKNYKLLKVNEDKFVKGDILTFSLRSRLTNHIAVYLGNEMIIHSINYRGVCIMPLKSIYKRRITSIYRIFKCQ